MIYKNENPTTSPNHWILNDTIQISLEHYIINTEEWLEKNMIAWKPIYQQLIESDELDMFSRFLQHGFQPLLNCFGTLQDNVRVVQDTVNWFVFNGLSQGQVSISELTTINLAVNYNRKDKTFTVYKHDVFAVNKPAHLYSKRIGIFDSLDDVLALTENAIPLTSDYHIDWNKLYIYNDMHPVNVNEEIFDKQIKHVIDIILNNLDYEVPADIKMEINDELGTYDEHIISFAINEKYLIRFIHVLQGDYIQLQIVNKKSPLFCTDVYNTTFIDPRLIVESVNIKRNDILPAYENVKKYPITLREIETNILPNIGIKKL